MGTTSEIAAAYANSNSRTEGEMKQVFEDLVSLFKETSGHGTWNAQALSGDAFTPAVNKHAYSVTSQVGGAADNLANITPTSCRNGFVIYLKAPNSSEPITLKHASAGAGQLLNVSGADMILKDEKQTAVYMLDTALSPVGWRMLWFGFADELQDYRDYLAIGTTDAAAKVWAGPSGAAGAAAFRVLAAADIPSLATTILTSGTLGVARGGTGLASFTAGDLLYATGSTTLVALAKGTALQKLQMNSGATAPEWATSSGGVPFGGEGTRSLPTSGNWDAGPYFHSGNWTSTGTITANDGVRVYVTGSFTLDHAITVNTGQAGGVGSTGTFAAFGGGDGAGQIGNGGSSEGGGGAGYGGAGGNGGSTVAGRIGRGGTAYALNSLLKSSAGAGGTGSSAAAAGGTGGSAGGCLYIEAAGAIVINANISALGGAGTAGSGSDNGGGGGGAGGAVEIRGKTTLTVNAAKVINVTGGAGGNGGSGPTGGGGGGGGGGHILLWSEGSLAQNGTLTVSGGAAGSGSATQAAAAGSSGVSVTRGSTGVSVRFG